MLTVWRFSQSCMQMSINPQGKWLEAGYLLRLMKTFSPEKRKHCHLRFRPPTLPPLCFHPLSWDFFHQYENSLSLNKSLPQLQFISLSSVFFWPWQRRLGHEMELLELSVQDGKAGTNKSHLSLFTREVWEQPHYTVAWINPGPLSLPFTLGAWYNVLQAS